MSWLAAAGRILVIAATAAFLGWLYGYPLETLTVALVGCILFWLYQLQRVHAWLQDPRQAPPDAYGMWGELLARIYLHQRTNREIQDKLQANVKYLQDSFASMRDGVVMVNDSGSIKWMNAAVESLLGLRHPQDTGQTLTNLVREPQFNRYFLSGDYSSPLQCSVGGAKPRHLRVEITRFGEGERLLFVRDVSDAVRMEQIRRDFIANVSHELRTPLTVISGYLGTFIGSADDLPERYRKPLQQMSQQAERMENLLKDLLWLSRIESEKRDERRERVDVAGLLQELREELALSYPQGNVSVEVTTDKKIQGDYRELYSAISNLANNALKYSPAGTPVTIRWYSRSDKCIVEVEDEGVGIDEMHIPRLTERFYRVDDSRSSNTGGTGLGLAIVKHVVAKHGGELKIHSELGVGSTFTLIFPTGG
ncbi:MAG: phosphate regulon sensor histidine kinase PhoR [Halioglobus sp.]